MGMVWALRRLTDEQALEVCQATLGVLVLTRLGSGRCALYQADIERLGSQGSFEDIPMGKIILDQASAPGFLESNPWVGELEDLPYTVFYQHGQQSDSFETDRAAVLLERLEAVRRRSRDGS